VNREGAKGAKVFFGELQFPKKIIFSLRSLRLGGEKKRA